MTRLAVFILAAAGLVSCAGPQPTRLSGAAELPPDWLALPSSNSLVKSLDAPTQQMLEATKARMAAERQTSAYRFYRRYSASTQAAMENANKAADVAYLTSTRVLQRNLTPELYSTAATPSEANWDWYAVTNMDGRSLRDDWARFWLVDQPSRLSPYPIENTTGNP